MAHPRPLFVTFIAETRYNSKTFRTFATVTINNAAMAASMLNKIEYLVLMVAAFASRTNVTEAQAYRYLSQYGALALCDKHYGIMHTLSLEENIETLQAYCQRKGGKL